MIIHTDKISNMFGFGLRWCLWLLFHETIMQVSQLKNMIINNSNYLSQERQTSIKLALNFHPTQKQNQVHSNSIHSITSTWIRAMVEPAQLCSHNIWGNIYASLTEDIHEHIFASLSSSHEIRKPRSVGPPKQIAANQLQQNTTTETSTPTNCIPQTTTYQ